MSNPIFTAFHRFKYLSRVRNKCSQIVHGVTGTNVSFTTLAGLEPAHRSPGYSRFSKPLPYLLGLQRHSNPTKWVRQRFGTNPDQRQRKDLNLHRVLPLHSPSKRASYQLEYAAKLKALLPIQISSAGLTFFRLFISLFSDSVPNNLPISFQTISYFCHSK